MSEFLPIEGRVETHLADALAFLLYLVGIVLACIAPAVVIFVWRWAL